MAFDYEYYKVSADYIKERLNAAKPGFVPEIGVILGSGLGGFASRIEDPFEVPYKEIPNFLVSTAPGHEGKLIFGTAAGKKLVCMAGRFNSYEGYSFQQLTIPVRVLKLLGIEKLLLTNAAGGINTDYQVGDVMLIKDHIKLTCESPMVGPNVPEFGPRFFDMTRVYDKGLLEIAKKCAENSPLAVHEGVYFFFTGPQFETPAEIRAARLLGGDAAGMSTVTETLTAAHCGLPVLAMSLITNIAAGVLETPLSGDDVNAAAQSVGPLFEKYFLDILKHI